MCHYLENRGCRWIELCFCVLLQYCMGEASPMPQRDGYRYAFVIVTKWFGPIPSLYQHLKFIWLFIYESRLWAKFSPTSFSPTICSMSYYMYYTTYYTRVVVWHTTLPSCMHAFIHTKFSVPMEFNSAKHDLGSDTNMYTLCGYFVKLFSNSRELGI